MAKSEKAKYLLTMAEFIREAKPLAVSIDGQLMSASIKEFSTGSFGWYGNGSITLSVGGVPVKVQVGITLTVVNSKEADRE